MIRTLIIARRELHALFLSPLAWAVLAVIQAIAAYLFLGRVNSFLNLQTMLARMPNAPGVTSFVVSPLFGSVSIILLMVVPLLSMRLVADERRSGTLTLLLSAPVSMSEIVIGKFLGLFTFLCLMVVLITAMPLSLMAGTHLDLGKLAAGVLGLVLMLGAFAAAGLFMSTMTRQPVVAAVGSFGLLLLLWILGFAGDFGSAGVGHVLGYLSLVRHFQALSRGEVVSTDVVYYLLMITLFLVLGIRRLDADRLQQ